MRRLMLAAALAVLSTSAWAQPLSLKGPARQAVTLTAAQFAALPRVKVSLEGNGWAQVYEGPLLIDVLAKAGAKDGYQVALGLAEADPGTRAYHIILADRADGAPLGATAGPFQLVIEGDVRPARSARMVTSIEVRSLAAAAHAH